MDIIYQGQRPVPNESLSDINEDQTELTEEDEVSNNNNKDKNEDKENYKRDFFAMLEDVIELSSEYPSVLIDPEFHPVHSNWTD